MPAPARMHSFRMLHDKRRANKKKLKISHADKSIRVAEKMMHCL